MFLFRLGRDLGYWNVAELAHLMPLELLREWETFYVWEDNEMKKDLLQGDVQQRISRQPKAR